MIDKIRYFYCLIKNNFKEAGKIIDVALYFEMFISLIFLFGCILFAFKQLELFNKFGVFFNFTSYEDFENFFTDIVMLQPLILASMVLLYIIISLLTCKVDFSQLDEKIKNEYPKGFVVYIVTGLIFAVITMLGFILLPFFMNTLSLHTYNNLKDIILAMGFYLIIGGAVTQSAFNKRNSKQNSKQIK